MNESRHHFSHRLSVVWFTDLVGYSQLAARDHDRAIERVERFREIIQRIVPAAEGRVVKFLGDAALIESPSARAAIDAAIELHREMGDTIRTGLHLGDVSVGDDGDLYGDGVNGAHRIQTEALPGWILLSEDVWRRVRNRSGYRFDSLGERRLKGVEPMRLYRLASLERPGAADSQPTHASESTSADRRETNPSIAVLPFANISPDVDHDYFSDGITEEILTLLARIDDLKVISRTSVMQYKGTLKSTGQVAAELGVAAILEGSVRHAGRRVRITAQLIDAVSDRHLWAEQYDRDLDDIFAIQSDVAGRIVEALRVKLTRHERMQLFERPTGSVEAYQRYLKGRYFLNQRTERNLRRAIDHFRLAVRVDDQFAQAWVGLADSLNLIQYYAPKISPEFANEASQEARAAAQNAAELDPLLGEAHVSMGLLAYTEWQWEDSETSYKRGLELNSGYANGLHWYANLLYVTRRPEEALTWLERALDIDPLSLAVHSGLGSVLLHLGRLDEALEIYLSALDLDPDYPSIHNNVANVYLRLGRHEDALRELETFSALAPERLPPAVVAELRSGYATRGLSGFWESYLHALNSRVDELGNRARVDVAEACAHLGRKDETFDHLERMIPMRDCVVAGLPAMIRGLEYLLGGDPRYTALEDRMGLASTRHTREE